MSVVPSGHIAGVGAVVEKFVAGSCVLFGVATPNIAPTYIALNMATHSLCNHHCSAKPGRRRQMSSPPNCETDPAIAVSKSGLCNDLRDPLPLCRSQTTHEPLFGEPSLLRIGRLARNIYTLARTGVEPGLQEIYIKYCVYPFIIR